MPPAPSDAIPGRAASAHATPGRAASGHVAPARTHPAADLFTPAPDPTADRVRSLPAATTSSGTSSVAPPTKPPAIPIGRRSTGVPRLPTSSDHLIDLARDGLADATAATAPAERYAAAHLSALRAAAAVIGARARPEPPPARRVRPLSAWVLLATVAPELGEWAAFFAAGARKRANAEARLPGAVTAREADDLLRDAETFLAVVETKLGAQPLLYRGVG